MKTSINTFSENKGKRKLSLLTAYDYSTAVYLNQSKIDAILVGDSLGMVFQGHHETLPVTVDEMIYHAKAVKRGAPDKFIIVDMPFMSYQINTTETLKNAGKIIKKTGAGAVKIEGGIEILDQVKALIAAKIPVMGHLGLTPQSINLFGNYSVQGKTIDAARRIIEDACLLEQEGVFAIVLEGIPEKLAEIITNKLKITTVGIGAGRYVDGQVLVINDILGTFEDLKPTFVKQFAKVGQEMQKGIDQYIEEVTTEKFPAEEHVFKIKKDVLQEIRKG